MNFYRPDIRFPDKLSGLVRELKVICEQMVNRLDLSYLYINLTIFIYLCSQILLKDYKLN